MLTNIKTEQLTKSAGALMHLVKNSEKYRKRFSLELE